MIKHLLICILIGFSTLSGNAQDTRKIIILPQSKIVLHGLSNVNSFVCEVCCMEEITVMDLSFTGNAAKLLFNDNAYQIPIKNFICENNRMTRDLQNALNMADYPSMSLELKALSSLKDTTQAPRAKLKITLAGKSNTYDLTYESTNLSENFYRVVLTRDFNMSDFGIEPPTAMLGLIKVKEKIEIELDLYILLKL